MTYELAVELREHGFPQKPEDSMQSVYFHGELYTKPTEPTLSELIEACGDGFGNLQRNFTNVNGRWLCNYFPGDEDESEKWESEGATPEEAVARLYIALNPKKV